ncbi:MAG: phosphoribosyltransferase family protein [Bacteroidetes bacterium]|nr:phosphoribosyltransferase family protein [Bacteroidota bacterium]
MPDSITSKTEIIHGHRLRLFKDADAIQARVREMGNILTQSHHGQHPIVLGLMHGAFVFAADLVRAIDLPCTVDFWRLSSYGTGTKSSQSVRELMPLTVTLCDRHVILVEDIVDSGRTLTHALRRIAEHGPQSVTVVALLQNEASSIAVDHVGFISGGDFVVGYGLDVAHELRGLPALYYLENS